MIIRPTLATISCLPASIPLAYFEANFYHRNVAELYMAMLLTMRACRTSVTSSVVNDMCNIECFLDERAKTAAALRYSFHGLLGVVEYLTISLLLPPCQHFAMHAASYLPPPQLLSTTAHTAIGEAIFTASRFKMDRRCQRCRLIR